MTKNQHAQRKLLYFEKIRGAPVRQKLGMILENKVVQKLKLEKKLNDFFLEKILTIFDIEN